MYRFPQITLTQPSDVATIIPFLLGYQPHDAIAFLALDKGVVVCAAAQPLPDGVDPRELAAQLAGVLLSNKLTAVMLVGYGPYDPVSDIIEQAIDVFTDGGIAVLDAMRAYDSHLWHIGCDQDICKTQGMPYDPRTSAVAVAATVAGWHVAADRDALAARLGPVTGPDHDRMQAAIADTLPQLTTMASAPDAGQRVEELITEAFLAADGGSRLPDDRSARLLVLLSDPTLRNEAANLLHGSHTQIQAWTDLLRRAGTGSLAYAPAMFLALSALLAGDAVTANLATIRALQADPDDDFAQLLNGALQAGLSPQTLRDLLDEQ